MDLWLSEPLLHQPRKKNWNTIKKTIIVYLCNRHKGFIWGRALANWPDPRIFLPAHLTKWMNFFLIKKFTTKCFARLWKRVAFLLKKFIKTLSHHHHYHHRHHLYPCQCPTLPSLPSLSVLFHVFLFPVLLFHSPITNSINIKTEILIDHWTLPCYRICW